MASASLQSLGKLADVIRAHFTEQQMIVVKVFALDFLAFAVSCAKQNATTVRNTELFFVFGCNEADLLRLVQFSFVNGCHDSVLIFKNISHISTPLFQ